MKIVIRNQANVSNKYIRFAKWKIFKYSRKYNKLVYAEVYIKKISIKPEVYNITVRLGVPGPDIVVSSTSDNLKSLWSDLSSKMKRQLRKYKTKQLEAFS